MYNIHNLSACLYLAYNEHTTTLSCRHMEFYLSDLSTYSRGVDLHMAQLMRLPLTVSCFSKIQIGFTFLVPAHPGSPDKGPLNDVKVSNV